MLRLVHPAPKGQVSSRRRSSNIKPTPEEQARIRAAVRNLSRAFGGRDVLANVIDVSLASLNKMNRAVSYGLAVRLAHAAGIPVEQILSGKPHVVGACAICGRKGAR